MKNASHMGQVGVWYFEATSRGLGINAHSKPSTTLQYACREYGLQRSVLRAQRVESHLEGGRTTEVATILDACSTSIG